MLWLRVSIYTTSTNTCSPAFNRQKTRRKRVKVQCLLGYLCNTYLPTFIKTFTLKHTSTHNHYWTCTLQQNVGDSYIYLYRHSWRLEIVLLLLITSLFLIFSFQTVHSANSFIQTGFTSNPVSQTVYTSNSNVQTANSEKFIFQTVNAANKIFQTE